MKYRELLDERFGKYHVFSEETYADGGLYTGDTVIQIAHNDVWKDVWIVDNQIYSVLEVDERSMSSEELGLWKEYLNDS
jgi:hypothetical protein